MDSMVQRLACLEYSAIAAKDLFSQLKVFVSSAFYHMDKYTSKYDLMPVYLSDHVVL